MEEFTFRVIHDRGRSVSISEISSRKRNSIFLRHTITIGYVNVTLLTSILDSRRQHTTVVTLLLRGAEADLHII